MPSATKPPIAASLILCESVLDELSGLRSAIRIISHLRLAAGERLRSRDVTCQNFLGEKTVEPSVIGWMPSAQIYFSDPDGHSLEFIALLDDAPDAKFIGPLSAWRKRA